MTISGRKVLGVFLLGFGMLAGAAGAAGRSMEDQQRAKQGLKEVDRAERLGQAIGGALCSLSLAGPGIYLLLTDAKKPTRPTRDQRQHREQPEGEDTAGNQPWNKKAKE